MTSDNRRASKITRKIGGVARLATRIDTRLLPLSIALALQLAFCSHIRAQQTSAAHVGVLHLGTPKVAAVSMEAFRKGLRDLGYIEGNNIALAFRYAEGKEEQYASLAAELIASKPAVIVTWGTDVTAVVKKTTAMIPIVFALADRPDILGLVSSLSRPGSNVTGVTTLNFELSTKRLELLKETIPDLSRVTIVGLQHPLFQMTVKEVATVAPSLGIQLQSQELKSPRDLEGVFSRLGKSTPGALLLLPSREIVYGPPAVARAMTHRMASIASQAVIADAGGLMSYGPRVTDLAFRAATYVDKILKGAKPGELPVEQPTRFEFVINLKTAKQIGLTIPPNVLARADQVIK